MISCAVGENRGVNTSALPSVRKRWLAPSWSPNGRVLMFFRQGRRTADGKGGRPSLHSIDLTGYNERVIKTPQDASDPAWSPLKR